MMDYILSPRQPPLIDAVDSPRCRNHNWCVSVSQPPTLYPYAGSQHAIETTTGVSQRLSPHALYPYTGIQHVVETTTAVPQYLNLRTLHSYTGKQHAALATTICVSSISPPPTGIKHATEFTSSTVSLQQQCSESARYCCNLMQDDANINE